jgi:C4-dicarboxylate-specific signal transduction histidine kinase
VEAIEDVRFDSILMASVVRHIGLNAGRATANRSEPRLQIRISRGVRESKPVALVEFEDNGCGIPPALLEHLNSDTIADAVFRGPGPVDDRAHRGLGLGIPYCRKVIRFSHQGYFRIGPSGRGEGANVEIGLPLDG